MRPDYAEAGGGAADATEAASVSLCCVSPPLLPELEVSHKEVAGRDSAADAALGQVREEAEAAGAPALRVGPQRSAERVNARETAQRRRDALVRGLVRVEDVGLERCLHLRPQAASYSPPLPERLQCSRIGGAGRDGVAAGARDSHARGREPRAAAAGEQPGGGAGGGGGEGDGGILCRGCSAVAM